MGKAIRYLVLVGLVLVGAAAFVQYWASGVAIPNLQALTVPQAEAALNAAGLRLGNIETVDEANTSGTPDTVVGQSAPAHWRLPLGAAVDVTVLRTNNVLLRYDQPTRDEAVGNTLSGRWFNLVNLTNEELYIGDLRFVSVQDESLALDQSNWGWRVEEVAGGFCLQILPDALDQPIEPAECDSMLEFGWFVETDEAQRFWSNGSAFYVYQDNIRRATCQIEADRCEFWIEEAEVTREIAEYFYFVYDQQRFAIFNRSADRWMSLDDITINGALNLGREDFEPRDFLRAEDLRLLAPGQCVLFSSGSAETEAFPGCVQVIGQQRGAEAFWRSDFRVAGEECLGATDDTTLCIVPRR